LSYKEFANPKVPHPASKLNFHVMPVGRPVERTSGCAGLSCGEVVWAAAGTATTAQSRIAAIGMVRIGMVTFNARQALAVALP
jgi:hypothetical protein